MKGVIEEVWENESRNGQKYLTVQIAGEKYSVWDTKYFDQLQVGAEIDYDFRQSGNFKNITDLRPLQEQMSPPYQPNHRDRQITRLSCLKSASEILAPVHLDIDAKRDLVIDTARYFERYVFEDDIGALQQQDQGDQSAGNSR
jgi:hypothetical protein